MRELTKSMMRFSLAVPLLGVKQLMTLSMPNQENQKSAARTFDALNESAQGQLEGPLMRLFKVDDDLQRGILDTTFRLCPLDSFRKPSTTGPGRPSPGPAAAAGDSSPADASSPVTSTSPTSQPTGESGWGPIPA